ncbi:MAG: adenosine deaminase [SAR324 cluster bacterium]|nr:adenosine deaminase [SAR324 cluster bacterium]
MLATDPMLTQLPKVELHVHLEGFVDTDFLFEMLMRNNSTKSLDKSELVSLFEFKNFPGFINAFKTVVDCFKGPEDFYLLTKKALEAQAKDGVVYTETYFTPIFYTKKGIDYKEIMIAINEAAKEAEKKDGIQMRLIFDAVRNFGPESVQEVFELASKDTTGRVVAVGLGGDEANFPAQAFIDQFAWAQAQGFCGVCHAGETAGEQSMLDAVELLNARRLGHALKIKKGSRIEEVIQTQNISLELCPTSNLKTGQIESLKDHPFAAYMEEGYQISINSDDPGFFGSSILGEFQKMGALHNFQAADYCQLSKRAVDSSFLNRIEKDKITTKILDHFDKWKG